MERLGTDQADAEPLVIAAVPNMANFVEGWDIGPGGHRHVGGAREASLSTGSVGNRTTSHPAPEERQDSSSAGSQVPIFSPNLDPNLPAGALVHGALNYAMDHPSQVREPLLNDFTP